MLDDLNDDAQEAGTETREENGLELTPEEVNAAYGLEEKGAESGAPPGDTREEREKAGSNSLETETDKGADGGGIEHIDTRNQELAGQEHPETGVPYEHCSVTLEDGKAYDVVAPRFESRFDVVLNREDYERSDYLQSRACNEKLQEAVQTDPELASRFSGEQLEQIRNGDTPKGYTWHHDVYPGQLQLVDSSVHAITRHTGGRVLWGGGKENR